MKVVEKFIHCHRCCRIARHKKSVCTDPHIDIDAQSIQIQSASIYMWKKWKPQCVLMLLLLLLLPQSQSWRRVTTFSITLPVASRKPIIVRHCHSYSTLSSAKVDSWRSLEGWKWLRLPPLLCDWIEPPLPHSPAPDLSISTSPDSYPTPMVAFHIGGHLSPHLYLYRNGSWGEPSVVKTNPCCHIQHLKSAITFTTPAIS